MNRTININLDNVLFGLVCGYAFFIPLEKVLEVLFNVDTVLKPYRVFALLIIGTFVLKLRYRATPNPQLKRDIFLYAVFLYGIVITVLRMGTTKFHMGYLYNDTFQLGLYLCVFVVTRHINLTRKRVWIIIRWLTAGIFVNAAYLFHTQYVLHKFARAGGMMDNANYFALSVVMVILLFLMERDRFAGWWRKALWWMAIAFLTYMLVLAGSRISLAILAACLLIAFTLVSYREKLRIVVVTTAVTVAVGAGVLSMLDVYTPLRLVNRIQNKRSGDDPRMPLWTGVVKAAQESNFLGLGVGQFKGRFSEFYVGENNDLIRRITQRNYFLSPHSDYFALLAVYGIIGLLGYLVFLFANGRNLLLKLRSAATPQAKRYFAFALVSLVALVLFGIVHESLSNALFWLLLGTSTTTEFLTASTE